MANAVIFDYILENYREINVLDTLMECEISFLRKRCQEIKISSLYKYEYHGLYHSQKVLLFAYLIGKHQNLDENDMKILLDAAIYHDIGRSSDAEDTIHGYSATLKFDQLFIKDEFYKENSNMDLLKAISDAHSVDDKDKRKIFDNHDVEEKYYGRYSLLCDILKDADALDRARFPKSAPESIKEEFLRFQYSKDLIDFAFYLNHLFRIKIDEMNYLKYKNKYNGSVKTNACFHGIGWDFCKLESILDYGILSNYAATKELVEFSRNFNGNNSDMWISAIDSTDVSKDGTAYHEFIDNNICFYCFVGEYHKGEKNKSKAHSEALPILTDLYTDESFVFDKIELKDIYCIILPNKLGETFLKDLDYLHCSNNFQIIKNRVEYYYSYIENICGVSMDKTKVYEIIQKLTELEISFGKRNYYYQKTNLTDFMKNTTLLVNEINCELCNWMSYTFREYFGLSLEEEPTVGMVVRDILERKKISYETYSNENTETIIRLGTIPNRCKKLNCN